MPVPVSPVMRTGHVGGGDAARGGEERLHFLGEEDGVALILDRVGRPQRGAAALLFARALERERGAADAKDVAQEDGLERIVRDFAKKCKRSVRELPKFNEQLLSGAIATLLT